MKLHANTTKISTTEYVSQIYQPRNMGTEAIICGSCPYDECVEDSRKAPCKCDYFNKEFKKLRRVTNERKRND